MFEYWCWDFFFLPLNLSEERGFLQVDWDCFLTDGDFGIFCHVVRNGSWSCVLSWATCRLVALRNWARAVLSSERLAPVESCHGLCKDAVLLVVRDTPSVFHPLSSWHWAQRRALRMRERTGLLDMSWILTLVHLSRETTQDKVELPLHSPYTVGYPCLHGEI